MSSQSPRRETAGGFFIRATFRNLESLRDVAAGRKVRDAGDEVGLREQRCMALIGYLDEF